MQGDARLGPESPPRSSPGVCSGLGFTGHLRVRAVLCCAVALGPRLYRVIVLLAATMAHDAFQISVPKQSSGNFRPQRSGLCVLITEHCSNSAIFWFRKHPSLV